MGIFFYLWGFNWLIYEGVVGVVGVVACFSIRQTFLDKYFVAIILEATTLLHYYTLDNNHKSGHSNHICNL